MRARLCVVLLTVLAAGLLFSPVLLGEDRPPPGRKDRESEKPPKGKPAPGVLEFVGVLVPSRPVYVCPRISGQVREVLVEEGATVKAGQVLFRLDRTTCELEHKLASAAVDRARALLAEEEANRGLREQEVKEGEAEVKEAAAQQDLLKRKVERLKELAASKAASEAVLAETESELRAAEAHTQRLASRVELLRRGLHKDHLAAVKAELAAAEAQRDLARSRLDATELQSSVAGTVLLCQVGVGDSVRPAGPDGQPTRLCEIADLGQLEVRMEVSPGDLTAVSLGTACEIQPNKSPGNTTYQGKVVRVVPVVSRETGTVSVRVKVTIPANDHVLKPGMSVVVRVPEKP